MFLPVHRHDGRVVVLLLFQTLCLCATWAQAATTLPQGGIASDASIASLSATVALIPSAPSRHSPQKVHIRIAKTDFGIWLSTEFTVLIPSGPIRSESIPSGPTPSGLISSAPAPSGLIPPGPRPSGVIPSGPALIPSATIDRPMSIQTVGTNLETGANGGPTPVKPPMESTDEALKPVPPATTAPGNPNGHHEITEPNLTVTGPCRGCSPVIEISVTGFDNWPQSPVAEQAGSSKAPPSQATITAGSSQLIISKQTSGNSFIIGGSTTVAAGQTVTIDNTPVVVQTTAGRTEVVVGGINTVPLLPNSPESAGSQITEAPILSPLTIAGQTITANAASQFIIGSQTLQPGGPAITVDGTTISLLPSATAVVINGVTSTLAQAYGAVLTTTTAPLLTVGGRVYTANRAGYYILGPGTTLVPGGAPVTISGTVISLGSEGTMAVIQGSTSFMTPVSTIVTLTRPDGLAGGAFSSGGNFAQSTAKATSGAASGRGIASFGAGGWLEGCFMLGVLGLGWLAVWL
ncbi:hypothetical protein K469DRAFT_733339 [Zopfia rhizophila CBS 207.26]|uniref:Uncharacterized protein n=1 Tax=Zopfia rhizophila CBS 207.26 TaxID=1314779 RepID=A0A6A6EIV9_9PEZI|nr:hypothetical protein K469DRAFT_733339 [Zopfia rhizophila CBS 207.26]